MRTGWKMIFQRNRFFRSTAFRELFFFVAAAAIELDVSLLIVAATRSRHGG